MHIPIEQLQERQRKKIIAKNIYLRKKFRKYKKYLITITFRDFEQYLQFEKRDRKKMIDNLRKNYGFKAGFMVVEVQKRAVPHWHMIAYLERKLYLDKQFGHLYEIGMTNIKKIRNKHVLYYVIKYLQKDDQKEVIKYKKRQRFFSFYYKNKLKDKEWKLKSLTGINKIIKKYDLKKWKVGKENIIVINGGNVIRYRIYTLYTMQGLWIYDWYVWINNDFYQAKDFENYREFLNWFECNIVLFSMN